MSFEIKLVTAVLAILALTIIATLYNLPGTDPRFYLY